MRLVGFAGLDRRGDEQLVRAEDLDDPLAHRLGLRPAEVVQAAEQRLPDLAAGRLVEADDQGVVAADDRLLAGRAAYRLIRRSETASSWPAAVPAADAQPVAAAVVGPDLGADQPGPFADRLAVEVEPDRAFLEGRRELDPAARRDRVLHEVVGDAGGLRPERALVALPADHQALADDVPVEPAAAAFIPQHERRLVLHLGPRPVALDPELDGELGGVHEPDRRHPEVAVRPLPPLDALAELAFAGADLDPLVGRRVVGWNQPALAGLELQFRVDVEEEERVRLDLLLLERVPDDLFRLGTCGREGQQQGQQRSGHERRFTLRWLTSSNPLAGRGSGHGEESGLRSLVHKRHLVPPLYYTATGSGDRLWKGIRGTSRPGRRGPRRFC